MMVDICCSYFVCALGYGKYLSEKLLWCGKVKISEVQTEERHSVYVLWKAGNICPAFGNSETMVKRELCLLE